MKLSSLNKPNNKKHTRQPLIERLFAFKQVLVANHFYLTLLNSFYGNRLNSNVLENSYINRRLKRVCGRIVNQFPFKPYLAA